MTKAVVCCFTVLVLAAIGLIYTTVDNVGRKIDAALSMVWLFVVALGIIVVVVLALGAGIILYALWTRHVQVSRRPVDGAFPLQSFRVRRWRDDFPVWRALLFWLVGERLIVNINNMVSAAARVDGNGYQEIEPAAGWAAQVSVRQAVERTNAIRAMFPGDDVRRTQYGSMSSMPRATASAWKVIDGKKEPLPEPAQLPAPPAVEPLPIMTPERALTTLADDTIYLGQQRDGGRALAAWNTRSASTLGIFGANGTGKTASVATMAALAMLRWGWNLHIWDGKDAGDWDEFGNHALVTPVGSDSIDSAIDALWAEYQRREALMKEYRARKYSELPPDVRAMNPRWALLFEEFGSTRLLLRNRARLKLDQAIDVLCSKARYTGWHGVFVDQRPSDYTDQMKGNLKAIACFKLAMNQGHAVNAYDAHKLADVGEFQMNDGRYFAFHAEPLVRSVLMRTPVPKRVPQERSLAVPSGVSERSQEVCPPPAGNGNGGNAGDLGRWDDLIAGWFAGNPQALTGPAKGISDVARLMAEADGRPSEYENYKGLAHRLFHEFRASVRVKGKPIGIDVTTEVAQPKE